VRQSNGDTLSTVHDVLPTCPLCLHATYHVRDALQEPVVERKFHAVVQCAHCRLVWQIEVGYGVS
jgi:hypothetical protein